MSLICYDIATTSQKNLRIMIYLPSILFVIFSILFFFHLTFFGGGYLPAATPDRLAFDVIYPSYRLLFHYFPGLSRFCFVKWTRRVYVGCVWT